MSDYIQGHLFKTRWTIALFLLTITMTAKRFPFPIIVTIFHVTMMLFRIAVHHTASFELSHRRKRFAQDGHLKAHSFLPEITNII
ncbi:MAG: hypothetical protein KIH67_002305 [Candidatus Moranbacteria bacterium]|nr:hypothetical protein [Candidatus Moranbacteria bacterium]